MDFWRLYGSSFCLGDAMVKFLLVVGFFLSLWSLYLTYKADMLKNENIALQSEKNALLSEKKALIKTIKNYEEAKIESDKTIKMLRNEAKKDKKALDWYNQPVPYSVLGILQKRNSRDKAN